MAETLAAPVAGTATPPAPAPIPAGFAADETALFAPNYPLPRLELARGEGVRVWDVLGREYLDFTSGIAVLALGHAPEGLAEAVAKQMNTLGHCSNLYANRPAIELARELLAATGWGRAFFCNSGAEANEAALKFARARAGAKGLPGRDILAFHGGFHGRTAFALAATHHPDYRAPFEPLVPGIRFAPFGDVAALDTVLDANVCAVIVEPVQGEAGVIAASRDFLQALRERTEATGAALIFDEVQTGMGRTGRLLAAEHYGVMPDYVTLSKALGNGFPVAAVLMTADAAATLKPGMHGCTFGGGAPAATAARFVLERVSQPAFLERVRRVGRHLGAALESLAQRHAGVKEARGLGLLRAIELSPGAPYDAPTLIAAARERGLLLVRGGERAIRVIPPLTVTEVEVEDAIGKLDAALAAHEGR